MLITGHTGFKGAWLAFWLNRIGATVTGVALAPEGERNLYKALGLADAFDSVEQDIRDREQLCRIVDRARPDLILHLAAQSLVRRGYQRPVETFETNVTGTANVLEAARRCEFVRGILIVTSDKCYAQNGTASRAFTEADPLGGHDPYSASKACAEIVTTAFRDSYAAERGLVVMTARAGNVVGGGDWSEDRLVPDAVRAAIASHRLEVRFPDAIRPWQHVLESLQGYLRLSLKALSGDMNVAQAWNFGPDRRDEASVRDVVALLQRDMPIEWVHVPAPSHLHEAAVLRIDATKARTQLGWTPKYNVEQTMELTAQWYRRVLDGENASLVTAEQLERYAA